MAEQQAKQVYFVCAGQYHDMNHARVEMLKLFAEHPHLRVRVAENFSDIDAIKASDMLVTYTCLLYTSPSPRDQRGSRMPSSA